MHDSNTIDNLISQVNTKDITIVKLDQFRIGNNKEYKYIYIYILYYYLLLYLLFLCIPIGIHTNIIFF